MLEAMSYGVKIIASDIPANLEVGLNKDDYFHCGEVKELSEKIKMIINNPVKHIEYDMGKYDWDKIAGQVVDVYLRCK